jgi:hypothetical protein
MSDNKAAADNVLGKIDCLLCSQRAVLRENKNSLAYYGCPECGCQVQTRSRAADVKLRKLMIQPAAPAPPPAAKPASTKETPREEKPVVAAARPAPAAAAKRGLFGRG